MVIGFPSLQGTMGKYYALASGESNDVAWPSNNIPTNFLKVASPNLELGYIVSIADKMDTIVGYFNIDERPQVLKTPIHCEGKPLESYGFTVLSVTNRFTFRN